MTGNPSLRVKLNIVVKLYRKLQKHGYECHSKRCEDYELHRIEFGAAADKWEIYTSFGNSSGKTMVRALVRLIHNSRLVEFQICTLLCDSFLFRLSVAA